MFASLSLALLLTACPMGASKNDALVHQLDREIIALKERLAYLQASGGGAVAAGEPAPIYAELVQIFSGSEVKVEREGSTTRVVIPHSILFSSASFRIRTEAEGTLDLLATALNLHPDYAVVVEGHTDDSPVPQSLRKYYPTNWEISLVRASALARELIDTWKVLPSRVTVSGRGSLDPVAENDTPEGRAANRRVVVIIRPPVNVDIAPGGALDLLEAPPEGGN